MKYSRFPACIATLILLLWALSLFASCFFGACALDSADIVRVFLSSDEAIDQSIRQIVLMLRLPRALLAALCGGSLAVAGVALQGVLRNPLADPYTLGISQGAACGASLVLIGNLALWIPWAAFAGAMLATFATLWLGQGQGRPVAAGVLLAGIAVSTFFGSLVALIKALNEESVTSIVFWIMGSLQGRSWESLPIILVCLIPASLVLALEWRALDVLALGDDQALGMGVSIHWVRIRILLAAGLLTAACVAVAGVIGFVGLVVPHILRLLFGMRHAVLIIAAFFAGGILLLWADVLARTVLSDGQEVPVGVVTAFIGGPFFAMLLKRKNI
ncbi:MAG: iron ABC transporter permease [Desulfovibrionaceae bacterium]|nr:iron ABC transporter permease [Desulfovibrionaceae bacterium]